MPTTLPPRLLAPLLLLMMGLAGCSQPGPLRDALHRQGLGPDDANRIVLLGAPDELGGRARATFTDLSLIRYIRRELEKAQPAPAPDDAQLPHARIIELYDGIRTPFPVVRLRLVGQAVQPLDQPDRWYRCPGLWELTDIDLRTAALRTPTPAE